VQHTAATLRNDAHVAESLLRPRRKVVNAHPLSERFCVHRVDTYRNAKDVLNTVQVCSTCTATTLRTMADLQYNHLDKLMDIKE